MAEDSPMRDGMTSRPPARRNQYLAEQDHDFADYGSDDFDEGGLDLAAIWRTLWSRRFWILGASLIGLAIALAYSLLQTPLYRSSAVLELNPPTVPILSGNGSNGEDLEVPNTDWQFLATQYGILRSRSLAERVVQDLNLAGKADEGDAAKSVQAMAGSIAGGLTVKPVPDSRLVELTYTSVEPADAARYVNGFAEAFVESTLDRRYEATAAAREFLEKRIQTVRQQVNDSERKLVDYAKANNIIILGGEGEDGGAGTSSLTGTSLESLNAALAAAQQKRIAAEQRYRQSSSITEVSQSTAQLRQEKAQLEAEYREKSTYLQADYPDMVRLKSRIDALDREIRQEAGTTSNAMRAEYQAALAEEASLREKVRQLSSNALNERERSIQYNILQRELDTNRTLYDALLERFNQVGVASGIGTAQAAIVDRGEVPGAPFSPNIPRNLVLGLLLGLGLGAALAFAYEMITDTIKTPEDIREKLRLAPLGVIPRRKRNEDIATELHNKQSAIYEAYAALQATLQFSTSKGVPRSVLVTSAQPAEGKSTTSYILALQLAETGKSVLLLDADMRKPSFVVEEQIDKGLSCLLSGDQMVGNHIIKTSHPNLWLMTSGPAPPNPAHILNTDRLHDILDGLAANFDIVIVDGPPIHGFADAQLLGAACEGVLFVIESGKTRTRLALSTLAQIQQPGITLLGAALTKFKAYVGDYGYSYKYYEQYAQSGPRYVTSPLAAALLDGKENEDEGENDQA